MTGDTILVAEDESSEMLKELLELGEYTVEVVETAKEAVAALRALAPNAPALSGALTHDFRRTPDPR